MLPHPHHCCYNCEPTVQFTVLPVYHNASMHPEVQSCIRLWEAVGKVCSVNTTEWRAYLEHCGGKLWGLSAAVDPPLFQTAWKVCWWPSAETHASWSLLLLQQSWLIYCCCSSWHMDLLTWSKVLQPIWTPQTGDSSRRRRRRRWRRRLHRVSLSLSRPQTSSHDRVSVSSAGSLKNSLPYFKALLSDTVRGSHHDSTGLHTVCLLIIFSVSITPNVLSLIYLALTHYSL